MFTVGLFLILTLLVLFQVNVLQFSFAFALLSSLYLFSRRDFQFWWIIVFGILFALFTNLNIGLVILAFSVSFLVLDLTSRLLPDNRLVKGSLVVVSLILGEYSLRFFGGLT